jgi:putative pyruvate formate lyase activating enzyme
VVWNTNGYASPTTLRLLDGVVDVYLVDFRHGASACAQRYGVPGDSVDIIRHNLRQIAAQDTALIVRHLQLPTHFECCTASVLRWLAAELPDVSLNLMHGQYRPARLAYRYPEINRRLTPAERKKAMQLACDLDLMLVT